MKIVFAGNKERGCRCLERICQEGYKVPLVIAHPMIDMQKSSGNIKHLAKKLGSTCIQPEQINASEPLAVIARYEPDLIILAGYGQIVKKDFLAIPKIMTINLHGGKLPDYRGSSPINWMIINGEHQGGVSIIEVDEGIDTGPILASERFPITPDDTAQTVLHKTVDIFPQLLIDTLRKIETGTLDKKLQQPSEGCYYPLRCPADGLILWESMTATEVFNMIRALTKPYPGAFSHINEKKIYIWEAQPMKENIRGIPGRIHFRRQDGIAVMCRDRCLLIKSVQIENGPIIKACDAFLKTGENFLTCRNYLLRI